MSDSTPRTPREEPSPADALRAEIAATRAELERAAELLRAGFRQHAMWAVGNAPEAAPAENDAVGDADEPEPETDQPIQAQPEVAEPEVTDPEVTDPEVTEPEVTEPEVTEPEVAQPGVAEPEPAPTSTRRIIREPAVISDRIEILPAPGRNLPAVRPAVAQRGIVAGLALAAVVYLLTRRRRRF